jgi:aminoglycoside phosphotransferase (APT) family kinase protein
MTEPVATITRALGAHSIERFAGGEFGAFRIETANGAQAVLKLLPAWPELALSRVQSAADLVALLLENGYPAPRFLDVGEVAGTVYTVQEHVEGHVRTQLPTTTFTALLQLSRQHQGILPSRAGAHWGTELIARIRKGEELQSATDDERVRTVLGHALEIAATADPTIFRTTDIVHGDFHPGNVLVRGDDQVAAVIDWETAQPGDSRADLLRIYAVVATWLPPESPEVNLFRRELDATTPREIWLPMAAELVVHHLRYGLFAKPDALDWVLREAEILLPRRKK